MAVKSPSANLPKTSRFTEYVDNQDRLPFWARSTNPIVRRHLGLYWRTLPPEIEPFIVIFAIWSVLIGIGVLFQPFISVTMITFLASVMVLPISGLLYAHVLLTIAIDASNAMQQEFSNNTFELLQATPMTLPQILLGKVAAAMWRRMDDIVMLSQLVLAFSPPIVYTMYINVFPADDYTALAPALLALLGMVVATLRIFLEPLMIGVISVFIGVVVPGKGRAISSAVVIGAFYFLLINLLSRLPQVRGFEAPEGPVPPNGVLIIVTDLVLPVLLPILITLGLLKLAEYVLRQD
ncbi:MAG: hypothetical protein AAF846_28100 [Chloroflexota bacterium]